MGERILVPFEGSPLSRRALERALVHHPDAEITTLYVLDPLLAVYEAETEGLPAANDWYERTAERAARVTAEAERLAADHGRGIETVVEPGRPARTILSVAAERGVDHIVIGSHGREGVSRLVLGSVAERVVRQAPIPVTVVR
jgi:nucleotide-binding universal stress UspA family protein